MRGVLCLLLVSSFEADLPEDAPPLTLDGEPSFGDVTFSAAGFFSYLILPACLMPGSVGTEELL